MIRYSLKCDNAHQFDSWFASSEAFEKLRECNGLSCPHCGSSQIAKTLMAPSVGTEDRPLSNPAAEPDLARLRREIEANSEDVGPRFASEARAMHAGDSPARAIRGEAKAAEAKALISDGIPVLPLPFLSKSKAN